MKIHFVGDKTGAFTFTNDYGTWKFANRIKFYKFQFLCRHPKTYIYDDDGTKEEICERCFKCINKENLLFTLNELDKIPAGSRFKHSMFGKGVVVESYGVKSLVFDDRKFIGMHCNPDVYPWDKPMTLITEE